jgi:hypothetical protein
MEAAILLICVFIVAYLVGKELLNKYEQLQDKIDFMIVLLEEQRRKDEHKSYN